MMNIEFNHEELERIADYLGKANMELVKLQCNAIKNDNMAEAEKIGDLAKDGNKLMLLIALKCCKGLES